MGEIPSWDAYFMTMAYLCATRSKDPDTHVGAVIVGPDHEVRSTGYNGLPRYLLDDVPERFERPEKYSWFEHAERNATYSAARVGVSVKGCRMYTCGLPCIECARAIVQAGIKEVVYDLTWTEADRRKEWVESHKRAMNMLEEAHVKLYLWNGPLAKVVRFQRGKILVNRSSKETLGEAGNTTWVNYPGGHK